jgi:hypothetical protein
MLAGMAVLLAMGMVQAAKVSDVRATKHNLSAAADGSPTPSGTVPVRTIKASTETQVCVFCHTPHGASAGVAPLWNRTFSSATYTSSTYTSTSMEANATELAAGPGGSSKLCLSCHDGTMAIDKVNVLNGASNPTIVMKVSGTVTSPAYMPAGSGATTGFTRNLGTNLSNDHPISFTYDSTLATNDGELRVPDGTVVGNRVIGANPKVKMPLENNQVQCATCHDPHLNDTLDPKAKFLRMNRLQVAQPVGGTFNQTNDIICLACHNKAGTLAGNSWAYSAHANSNVASQTYTTTAANQREFPTGTKVWQAACLNCHDTHTVEGARRLLREGTDNAAPSNTPKIGGNPALEETCYQCHTTSGNSAVTYTANSGNAVPDIKTDFTAAGNKHMPITTSDQANNANLKEVHEIGGNFNDSALANCNNTSATSTGNCGKDLLESRTKLGVGVLSNRHAECTDCHNPHRVVKFRDFRGASGTYGNITTTPAAAGTHPHTDDGNTLHSNIASGVLRGSWGVEPTTYTSNSFHSMPSAYAVKRGDPGANVSVLVGETYLTREYQICLKCHSDYGYSDNNVYPIGNRPKLTSFAGGTTSGTNGLTIFTNQAKEFQSPSTHQGEPQDLGNDAGSADSTSSTGRFNVRNHRSWHPVRLATGRDTGKRNISGTNPWLPPWNNQVGSNTMYCSDCHGSAVTTSLTTVIPEGGDNGNPWGPHGSSNDFILKGQWTDTTGSNTNLLCFKCHVKAVYSGSSNSGQRTGFYDGSSGKGNLHNYHVNRIGNELRCTWCHVAVPHGWKNRSLLVNLNDVGEEAGQGAGSSKEVATNGSSAVYTQEPYYFKAKLKIASFATSGSWAAGNCGSVGKSGTGLTNGIINGSGGSGNTTGTGKNWMTSTCSSPP